MAEAASGLLVRVTCPVVTCEYSNSYCHNLLATGSVLRSCLGCCGGRGEKAELSGDCGGERLSSRWAILKVID